MPARNDPENSEESQVNTFDIVLIEPLFEQLGTKDVKLGKRLDGLKV
jgi:hypothetical protein